MDKVFNSWNTQLLGLSLVYFLDLDKDKRLYYIKFLTVSLINQKNRK